MESKIEILGIGVNNTTKDEVLAVVESWLKNEGKHYIVTPNPEFLMAAQKDREFRAILNKADLSIPDGMGLLWASKLSGKPLKERIAGVDIVESLCKLAVQRGYTVGLLGAKEGVAEKTAKALVKKHPGLKVVFIFAGNGGPQGDGDVCLKLNGLRSDTHSLARQKLARDGHNLEMVPPSQTRAPIDKIVGSSLRSQKFIPSGVEALGVTLPSPPENLAFLTVPNSIDLLFVAYGQVKQEKWIDRNLNRIPVKVAMGVGGTFDYLSGEVSRAPKIIQNLGLEWLYRLFRQPWRIKRQLVLLRFVWLVLRGKN